MLNPDFRDILSAFIEEQVDFVVVGAYALAALEYDSAWKNRKVVEIEGLTISVLGRNDLIRKEHDYETTYAIRFRAELHFGYTEAYKMELGE